MIELTATFYKDKLDIQKFVYKNNIYTVKNIPVYFHTKDFWIYKIITVEEMIFDLKFDVKDFSWSVIYVTG